MSVNAYIYERYRNSDIDRHATILDAAFRDRCKQLIAYFDNFWCGGTLGQSEKCLKLLVILAIVLTSILKNDKVHISNPSQFDIEIGTD